MNRSLKIAACLLILAALSLATGSAFATDRVALVIGNGLYQKVPALPNPPRDATDIGHALERLNFKVTQLTNASAVDMRKAIVEFGRAAEGSEMAVVFYAGHGMEAGGENWLIPVDAELRSDTDVESEAVSLRSVSLQVSKARQLGLVILDACRNNPFAAKMQRSLRTRAVTRGLAPTEPTDNVLVAYAARDGTTANDGEGRNSPFTTALLHNIETPGLEISFLFRNVRDEVMSATKREQQPFIYGSLSKEAIYLKPATPVAKQAVTAAVETSVVSEDEQFWRAIGTSTVAGLYEEFISRYPKSNHVAEARERIKDLRSTQVAAVSPMTVVPRLENDTNTVQEGASSGPKLPDRNLFTPEDAKRVATVGAAQQLKMPPFTIAAAQEDTPGPYSRFVGVWSNKRGWGDGKGRHGMLIITDVSATGLARGYYLWGSSTKLSWEQTPAGYTDFVEYIVNDTFSFKTGQTLNAKLDRRDVMTLSTFNPKKPFEKTSVELHPIWQLVSLGQAAQEPPVDRNAARAEPRGARSQPAAKPKPSGPKVALEGDARCSNMHDRLGCLCAVQNGGGISTDGRSWYSKHGTGTATNEAFVQCQIRAGRR